jgi:hypothetical protein
VRWPSPMRAVSITLAASCAGPARCGVANRLLQGTADRRFITYHAKTAAMLWEVATGRAVLA